MADNRYLAIPVPHWTDVLEFPNNLPPNTKIDRMDRDRVRIRPQPGLDIDDLTDQVYTTDGSHNIVLRRYQQSGAHGPRPLLVYMHGGGFVTGGLETDDVLCREIVSAISIVVVSIEYRLAPEHPFPAGFEDCLQVLKWVVLPSTSSLLNIGFSLGFLLGGTSAGGNFTSGLAHTLLASTSSPIPRPSGLIFLASSFCHPDVRPARYRSRILSVDEIDDAPGLTVSSIKYFAEKYGAPPADRRYSPLLHESRRGLAKKVWFQVCGWDPRRDEALLYEELLREDGVETGLRVYQGLPHGFWTTCPELEESVRARRNMVEGMRWLLE